MDQARISKLRRRFGWSQEKFAKILGAGGRLTVSQWETGFRNPSGPVKRFLTFLEKLSDVEFKKATELLEKIAEEELRKRSK
jgi:DNA-binding transcriptional regulator YiaG